MPEGSTMLASTPENLSSPIELDVSQYIDRENILLVPLDFAARRPVVEHDGARAIVADGRVNSKETRMQDGYFR